MLRITLLVIYAFLEVLVNDFDQFYVINVWKCLLHNLSLTVSLQLKSLSEAFVRKYDPKYLDKQVLASSVHSDQSDCINFRITAIFRVCDLECLIFYPGF